MMPNTTKSSPINKKEHIICLALIVLLLAITAVFLFKDQEITAIPGIIASVSLPFILLAICVMALYFAFEARAIQILMQPLIGKRSFLTFYRYALIDFYFSSITPGCSGGQPSQIFFMHRDKIPVSASSLSLLTFNMCSHASVILVVIVSLMITGLDIFNQIGFFKYLLIFGIAAQVFLTVVYMLAVFHPKLATSIVRGVINILVKLRIIKNKETTLEKAMTHLADYRRGAKFIKENIFLVLRTFVLSTFYIVSLYTIPFFVYKAFGLSGYTFFELVAIQAVLTVSVESLPIPGGIGVTESGFMLIYASIFSSELMVSALLLSRGINYYLGLLAGGLAAAFSMRSKKQVIDTATEDAAPAKTSRYHLPQPPIITPPVINPAKKVSSYATPRN